MTSRTILAKEGTYKKGDHVLYEKKYWVVKSWSTLGDICEYLCEETGENVKGEPTARSPASALSILEEVKKLQLVYQSTNMVLAKFAATWTKETKALKNRLSIMEEGIDDIHGKIHRERVSLWGRFRNWLNV
jgi:hypothetical protein